MSMFALVPGRVRPDLAVAGAVRDHAESILVESGFFEGAPFARIGLILHYAKRSAERPEYQPINREYGNNPIVFAGSAALFRSNAYAASTHASSDWDAGQYRNALGHGAIALGSSLDPISQRPEATCSSTQRPSSNGGSRMSGRERFDPSSSRNRCGARHRS